MPTFRWFRPLTAGALALGCAAVAPATARAGWITSIEASAPLNWLPFEETTGDTFADLGSDPLTGKADPGSNGPVLNVPGLVGKAVQFMDGRTGQMRSGKVVQIKGNQVTIHEDATRAHWKVHYAGVEPGVATEQVEPAAPTVHQAPVHKPGPQDFRRGDKVSFTDKYLQPQIGTITRINQRTATVDCESGAGWRVPFGMLRHVTDTQRWYSFDLDETDPSQLARLSG